MSSKPIVVAGSINLDLVATASRIPVAGETIIGQDFRIFFGGKGANQAVAAACLGAKVVMIGQLGSDVFGAQLRSGLQQAGVDTTAVDEAPGPSGVALISTDKEGENSIIVVPGANGHVTPGFIDKHGELICSAAIVLAQLEIPLETVSRLAELTTQHQIPLMLDPAPMRALPESLLRAVDWLTPNETETAALLGGTEFFAAEKVAKILRNRGARNVILKLGSHGCCIATSDGACKLIPAHKVNVVDTTAAGDAFNAAFAVAISEGKNPLASAEWATAVAALSVTRAGAQASMPTRSEVEQFLKNAETT